MVENAANMSGINGETLYYMATIQMLDALRFYYCACALDVPGGFVAYVGKHPPNSSDRYGQRFDSSSSCVAVVVVVVVFL